MYARSLSDDVVERNERLLSSTWWKLWTRDANTSSADAGENEVDDESKF